jgi:hypothetical protein
MYVYFVHVNVYKGNSQADIPIHVDSKVNTYI